MNIKRDGLNIYNEFLKPEGEGPFPTVIISHGISNCAEDVRKYADFLVSNGYSACIFDFNNGGHGSRSDGEAKDMSVLTEVEDLNQVMNAVQERPDVDLKNLFLMGASQGGVVSTYAAARRPGEVKALICFYPAYVLHDDARERMAGKKEIPESSQIMSLTVGPVYTRDALSFDIYDEMPKYDGDVLLVHGTDDPYVPVAYSERAEKAFRRARLVLIEGGRHGFDGEKDRQAMAEMLAFLRKETD